MEGSLRELAGYRMEKAKEMLSNAPVGSFLQLKRRSSGSQHSAILVSKDSNGVRILDANSDLDNVVKYTFWTFSAFAKKNKEQKSF